MLLSGCRRWGEESYSAPQQRTLSFTGPAAPVETALLQGSDGPHEAAPAANTSAVLGTRRIPSKSEADITVRQEGSVLVPSFLFVWQIEVRQKLFHPWRTLVLLHGSSFFFSIVWWASCPSWPASSQHPGFLLVPPHWRPSPVIGACEAWQLADILCLQLPLPYPPGKQQVYHTLPQSRPQWVALVILQKFHALQYDWSPRIWSVHAAQDRDTDQLFLWCRQEII